jgi:vacuolar iron transporter family protein
MARAHGEGHKIANSGWLRAAVLGANDGIVSTASLLLGIAAAEASRSTLLLTGSAALVAGAMSMAAGEYVSVSSQADTEKAALAEEQAELENDFDAEHRELTSLYVGRGLDRPLARQVAAKLMHHDPLDAHAREELGIHHLSAARPLQAALASALSFAGGAALPLAVATFSAQRLVMPAIGLSALASLALLGALSARASGAPTLPAVARVVGWSLLAMAITMGVGRLFGVSV